jgi:hypothetical protein
VAPLRVTADPTAALTGNVATTVASLPLSLATALPGESADLAAVHGGPGWPQRVMHALVPGVRGVLVVDPVPVPVAQVPAAPPVPVVIDHRYAANPVLARAADALQDWPNDALVEVAAVVAAAFDLDRVLLDHIATLRRVGRQVAHLDRLTWGPNGFYLIGRDVGGTPLLLSAHVTTGVPPSVRIRGLARELTVELALPNPDTARPAVLVRTTPDGASTAPTLWETSRRASWRRLHAAVTSGQRVDDLSDLSSDLATAELGLPSIDGSRAADVLPPAHREDHP